jgi:hypothetical protein
MGIMLDKSSAIPTDLSSKSFLLDKFLFTQPDLSSKHRLLDKFSSLN